MEIELIEVKLEITYKPSYDGHIQHCTRSYKNFFVDEEKYKRILAILEE